MQDGRLALRMRNTHQGTDDTLNFTPLTAGQNVRRVKRFVLANRVGGLKG